eukprot:CAMPEP_0114151204 /NCGR_PEP_ID=MMETSP0043_2-20121206/23130_1 /TAXON_ID=464988 /ORGANISM="Hemiselmis andersenii, Strain CCMP644" /LENGTH=54 /DNA_ID=CAMNT_0001246023 /DNA_START=361 /DNA_END=526 /DNA_ORIENTATION=-
MEEDWVPEGLEEQPSEWGLQVNGEFVESIRGVKVLGGSEIIQQLRDVVTEIPSA